MGDIGIDRLVDLGAGGKGQWSATHLTFLDCPGIIDLYSDKKEAF
jgi:hypothetical protein